jgi:hypothetical protein
VSRSADHGARIGVPATFFTKGLGVFGAEEGALLDNAAYFRSMGVKGGRLAVLASGTRGADVREFTPAELSELGLADVDTLSETGGSDSVLGADLDSDGWLWLLAAFVAGVFLWSVASNWIRSSRPRSGGEPGPPAK